MDECVHIFCPYNFACAEGEAGAAGRLQWCAEAWGREEAVEMYRCVHETNAQPSFNLKDCGSQDGMTVSWGNLY